MDLFKVYPLMDVEPVSASGSWITDVKGRKYLDLYGGHAVISVGHSHPHYIHRLTEQLNCIGYYSNSIQNPLQKELAAKVGEMSGFEDYQFFLCNSGAESIEVALKLASYQTGKEGIIAFHQGFHGRTAGALSISSNSSITVPAGPSEKVRFAKLNDLEYVLSIFEKEEIGAVVIECVQGIGGINLAEKHFYQEVAGLCKRYEALLIADEIQSGFGRTGRFFSFQHYSSDIQPDLITTAKGMGNGFPVGSVFISPKIEPKFGLLGSTFGGNYLACCAVLAVLEIIENENLIQKASKSGAYLLNKISGIRGLKEVRGRGLMIGLEFEFPVKELRKQLVVNSGIITGSSSNPNVLRILPALGIEIEELDLFIQALEKILNFEKSYEAVYIR